MSAATRERIVENLGSGAVGNLPPEAAEAARDAFIHALSNGMWLAAGVAAAGTLIALVTIAPKSAAAAGTPRRAEAPPAEAPVAG